MAICINCEEEYSDRRAEIGYSTCLDCGERDARKISAARTLAPLAKTQRML